MNKHILILAALLVALFFVACADVSDFSTTTTVPLSPSETPPQPIRFDNLESAVDFLQKPDYSNYKEKWKITYQQMVEDFTSDGYLLHASHKTANRMFDDVILYPCGKYEDIGVAYWFVMDGESYQVILYNTKEGAEYAIHMETQDYSDYRVVRFGVSKDTEFERLAVSHPDMSEIILSKRNGNICAESMIDATHYIVVTVVTDANIDMLHEFIEGLIIAQYSITH